MDILNNNFDVRNRLLMPDDFKAVEKI